MSMISPYFDYQFRIVVIGDSMVGKSSLLKVFSEGSFSKVCDPTVGVDFYSRSIRLKNNESVKLQLWDTAGQEKFRSIAKSYYRNCVGVLIVFDITDKKTFEHVSHWHTEARNSMRCSGPVIIIVGQKSDLENERQVSKDEGNQLARQLGGCACYTETSSLNGHNVEATFDILVNTIHEKLLSGVYDQLREAGDWDGVKVSQKSSLAIGAGNRSVPLQEASQQRSGDCC